MTPITCSRWRCRPSYARTTNCWLREAHGACNEHRDIASASLIEVWIDETERRTWFLFEATRRRNATGH
jgi:starvation-inducible DNA-binding protein